MKVVIASDIHGNLEYTKKLYQFCDKKDPDKIILLGDLLNNYYLSDYFEIDEIIKLMNSYSSRTICVRGNTDSSYDLERLNFPINDTFEKINIDGTDFYLTHGHLLDKYDYLFKDNYCFVGHTHRYNLDGNYLNPGSVGKPRGTDIHTCFYYESGVVYLINLDNFAILAQKKLNK